jgi:hypothetical protein
MSGPCCFRLRDNRLKLRTYVRDAAHVAAAAQDLLRILRH